MLVLPGARFEFDQQAGRYRISKIFEGENEEDIYRSPLTEVGVNASVGDYVLAIDGEELKGDRRSVSPVAKQSRQSGAVDGQQDALDAGRADGSYRPITDEQNLIYLDWVDQQSRQGVGRRPNGRVGYLHVPDMGANGIREFIKWYYPQLRKEGLDRRCACQRRRQRIANAHRAAAAKGAGAQLLAHQRRGQHVSRTACSLGRWWRCWMRTRRRTATFSRRCSARPDLDR